MVNVMLVNYMDMNIEATTQFDEDEVHVDSRDVLKLFLKLYNNGVYYMAMPVT